jgi:two-component sensor histidine kinase
VPAQVNFELDSDASASRRGREGLLELEPHVSPESFSDLTLIISELTANAVKYGPGTPIGVSVQVADDGLICGHVDDGGSGGVEMVEADPVAATGLGLLIVDTLARDWGVDPGGTRVWFEIAAAATRSRPV